MKFISKLYVAVVAMLFASAASAGTLYWQVADDGSGDDVTAQLFAQQGDNAAIALSNELDTPTGIQQADIGDYTDSTWRFYVELVNYDNDTRTTGYKWGYQDLVASGYVAVDATQIAEAHAAAVAHSNFANAPEPSSGLLLLMGGAILALRRRRQK